MSRAGHKEGGGQLIRGAVKGSIITTIQSLSHAGLQRAGVYLSATRLKCQLIKRLTNRDKQPQIIIFTATGNSKKPVNLPCMPMQTQEHTLAGIKPRALLLTPAPLYHRGNRERAHRELKQIYMYLLVLKQET